MNITQGILALSAFYLIDFKSVFIFSKEEL